MRSRTSGTVNHKPSSEIYIYRGIILTHNKYRGINWTWSRRLAIVLLILLFLLSIYIFPSINTWNIENNNLQQPRTSHITFKYNFDEQRIDVGETPSDILIDVALRYPRGTLIVDDPIDISGIAIQYGSLDQHVESLTIWFQNALAYPVTQDENGITEGRDLLINISQGNNKLVGNTTVVWVLEGTYNPLLGLVFTNETGTYAFYAGMSTDVAITVYPKAELAQILTNNVSMILTIAFYVLALVGTGNLVVLLWDRKPLTQNKKENSQAQDKPATIYNNVGVSKPVEGRKNTKTTKEHTEEQNC